MSVDPTAYVHPTAVIFDNVSIGANSYVGPFCVIGAPPEMRKKHESLGVVIGQNVRLEKAVVVDAGTKNSTVVMDDCMIMSGAHIGHDCIIAYGVTISPKAVVGGHVVVGAEANIGMNVGIHQHQIIGRGSMIGGNSFVTRLDSYQADTYIWPYSTYAGTPARLIGQNRKFSDLDPELIHAARLEYIEQVKLRQ